MNCFNIFSAESFFREEELLTVIGLGITIDPRCSNCIFIDLKNLSPPPPLWVPIKAILSMNESLQDPPETEIHAIALETIGGIDPLYSGAQKIRPFDYFISSIKDKATGLYSACFSLKTASVYNGSI